MKNILVVDNHPVMLKLMNRLLEKKDHCVRTAEDGLSALDTLNTFTPDVIFIDLVMPNITGDKLCRIIRSMPKLKNAYIVILSAIAAEENVDFIGFGANACIAKGPFDKLSKHIIDVVDRLDHQDSQGFSEEIIGLKEIYKREITKELISSKRHTEIVISNIAEGILELTTDARILFANPTGISLLGLPEEKLLGSHFAEIFQSNNDKLKIRNMLEGVREKTQVISENSPVSFNGKQISITISSVNDEEYHSIIVILNDITERKRAEKALLESEEKYRSILESIDEGYYELDLSGSFTFFNSSISKTFGYPGRDLMGKKIWKFTDEENSAKEYETLRQVRESGI
ncbi:MAG: PAS domain S-box protein, partial [Deltaproteobacteria bacterium]|nr:PAS domain S-box protein [Deltaproteobacteria bacterium]